MIIQIALLSKAVALLYCICTGRDLEMVGNCKRELLEYCFKLCSLYLNSCQFSERHWKKKWIYKGLTRSLENTFQKKRVKKLFGLMRKRHELTKGVNSKITENGGFSKVID